MLSLLQRHDAALYHWGAPHLPLLQKIEATVTYAKGQQLGILSKCAGACKAAQWLRLVGSVICQPAKPTSALAAVLAAMWWASATSARGSCGCQKLRAASCCGWRPRQHTLPMLRWRVSSRQRSSSRGSRDSYHRTWLLGGSWPGGVFRGPVCLFAISSSLCFLLWEAVGIQTFVVNGIACLASSLVACCGWRPRQHMLPMLRWQVSSRQRSSSRGSRSSCHRTWLLGGSWPEGARVWRVMAVLCAVVHGRCLSFAAGGCRQASAAAAAASAAGAAAAGHGSRQLMARRCVFLCEAGAVWRSACLRCADMLWMRPIQMQAVC
jgi:hypothetical protein